jgi:AcrR family transcriptional regulator
MLVNTHYVGRLSGDERKGSILEAAIEVFAQGGFRGATTAALARAAGITEALLYRHFRSKKQLFLGAVDQVLDRVEREVARTLEAHEHPVDALRALFRYFLGELRDNPHFGHLIYVLGTELRDPDVRRTYRRYQDRILDRLEARIRGWARDGYLRPDVEPRAAAWLILGAHQTLTLMEQSGRLGELGPEHVRGFVEAFLTDEARAELQTNDDGPRPGRTSWPS